MEKGGGATAGADRMAWLREARFGMFIHWGVYSVPAGEWAGRRIPGAGEWLLWSGRVPVKEYETCAPRFDPVQFDADAWARLARDAGMKYLVITAKHCDGFAMWPTSVSPWNIRDATPLRRDPLAELEAACDRQAIRLGFYFSHNWDWHEPDCRVDEAPNAQGRHWDNDWDWPDRDRKDQDAYLRRKALPQVEELVSRHHPHLIWFDVPGGLTKEQSQRFVDVVRRYRPDCIINDRVGNGLGDYGTPEQYIPVSAEERLTEVCMTHNETWGYVWYDRAWKSTRTVIRNLVDIASKGGNYLLNVGPTDRGLIPSASVRMLQEVGRWMERHGSSIYGTRGSPLPALPWGRATHRPGTLYLHVFDWPESDRILVPGLRNKVRSAYLLADPRRTLETERLGTGDVAVRLPVRSLDPRSLDEHDTVVVLEYDGEISVDPVASVSARDYANELRAADATAAGAPLAFVFKGMDWARLRPMYLTEGWTDTRSRLEWRFRLAEAGSFAVTVSYGAPAECAGNELAVQVSGQSVSLTVADTAGWYDYRTVEAGSIRLEAGEHVLSVRAVKLAPKTSLANVNAVTLRPEGR